MNLKEFRKNLGLSQEEFSAWLSEKNIYGRNRKPYSAKTIQSWEQGLRNVPTKVKNIIAEESKEKPLAIKISEVVEELRQIKTPLSEYTTQELLAEIERRCAK